MAGRAACLVLLCLPVMLHGQYNDLTDLFSIEPRFEQYDIQIASPTDYAPDFDYTVQQGGIHPASQTLIVSQNQEYLWLYKVVAQTGLQLDLVPADYTIVNFGPGEYHVNECAGTNFETEPTEPGPLDCREEQYPCTRLYSVHKPCKQCLKSLCFYSLRRVYVVNKEVCVRTVCAHEELLRADLCRDKYSKCGVMANSGLCGQMASSCVKSCGSC